MYVTVCPKCGHKIQADRPASNVPARCGECGMVFRGSTAPARDPVPEAGPGDVVGLGGRSKSRHGPGSAPREAPVVLADAGPRQPSRLYPVRSKRSPIPMVLISAFGLAGIIVMVAVLSRYGGTTRVVEVDPHGRRLGDRRVPRDQVAPRRGGWETGAPPAASQPPAAADGSRRRGPTDGGKEAASRLQPGDPRIVVTGWATVPDVGSADGSIGTLVGRVRNMYDRMVERVDLRLQIVDRESGRPLAEPIATVCRNIPPHAGVSFSARYDYLPGDEPAEIDLRSAARIDPDPPDESLVSWMVDNRRCRPKIRDGRVYVVTGSVRNRKAFTVTDVRLYAEFFSGDRVRLGSATGRLREQYAGRLRKGNSALFVIEFDTLRAGEVLPEQIRDYEIRLIARPE